MSRDARGIRQGCWDQDKQEVEVIFNHATRVNEQFINSFRQYEKKNVVFICIVMDGGSNERLRNKRKMIDFLKKLSPDDFIVDYINMDEVMERAFNSDNSKQIKNLIEEEKKCEYDAKRIIDKLREDSDFVAESFGCVEHSISFGDVEPPTYLENKKLSKDQILKRVVRWTFVGLLLGMYVIKVPDGTFKLMFDTIMSWGK